MYGTPIGKDIQHANTKYGGEQKVKGRFHGAWTGGFSAGYFNTVGSKEGFQPKSYSVTRETKNQQRRHEQRAEDYMDAEDLADLELRVNLELIEQYRDSDAMVKLFSDGGQGFGYDILRAMGWKGDSTRLKEVRVALDSSKGEGIGFQTQSFAKSTTVKKRKKLSLMDDDEEEFEQEELPRLMPKRKLGAKHTFVKRKKKINHGDANGRCNDGSLPLPGFVLMNDLLLPRVAVLPYTIPDEFEAEKLAASRRKRKFDPEPVVLVEKKSDEQRKQELPLDKDTAAAALGSSNPYPDDRAKYDRYCQFLRSCAEEIYSPTLDKSEEGEFVQVAHMFKPLQGAMASRFAKSGSVVINQRDHSTSKSPTTSRLETEFIPDPLLSKRFQLAPYDKSDKSRTLEGATSRIDSGGDGKEKPSEEDEESTVVIDPSKNEALEGKQADSELFDLIFGDDAGGGDDLNF